MKLVGLPAFAWVLAAVCLVGQVVFGQPTTEEGGCSSPVETSSSGGDLRNLARQTNQMAKVLNEVKEAVGKIECSQSSPEDHIITSTAATLLQSKTGLIILYLLVLQLLLLITTYTRGHVSTGVPTVTLGTDASRLQAHCKAVNSLTAAWS